MSCRLSMSRILGKSASLSLWRQLPSAELGVERKAAIVAGSSAAQVDDLAAHEAFDAVSHAQRVADGRLTAGGLDDAGQAGVDDARGSAALADDCVALKHVSPRRVGQGRFKRAKAHQSFQISNLRFQIARRMVGLAALGPPYNATPYQFPAQATRLRKNRAYQLPTSIVPPPTSCTIRSLPQSTSPPTQWGATSVASAAVRPAP